MKTVDFSETIAASDLKGSRSRHLIEFTKVSVMQHIVSVESSSLLLHSYFA